MKKKVALRLGADHLREIDRAAEIMGMTRSAFLRAVALQAGRKAAAGALGVLA